MIRPSRILSTPARGMLALGAFALGLCVLSGAPEAAAQNAADAGAAPREVLEGTKLDATLADITKARKDVRTLRASFVQDRRITLLATVVKSKGELTFLAPDRLKWDLAPPDDIAYFVGPEGLAYKTKSSSAAVPSSGANVARALSDLRALLGGDLGALRERYVLGGSRSPSDVEITGVAKDTQSKNAGINGFTLVLDKGLVVPLRAHLAEGRKDTIDLVFSNVVVNAPVDVASVRP